MTQKRLRKPRHVEEESALTRRADVLASLREQREAGGLDDEVFQVAQALILCGLPYRPTTETRLIRRARLGDGSEVVVVFSASSEAPLPFGSDRSLLHFIFDRAIKAQSRFVSWETAREFLTAMRMAINSGKNGSDLKKRFERIRGLSIYVRRVRASGETTLNMPVISRSHLPTSVDVRAEAAGQELLPLSPDIVYGIEIGVDFYNELVAHHVPVPAEIIRKTRKQSQLQDLMLFLHWRCYAAQSESLILWKYLKAQLWQADKKERRIKPRFEEAIKALRIIWPEMHAETTKYGLVVGPPINGVYLVPRATANRNLPKVETSDPEEIRKIIETSLKS